MNTSEELTEEPAAPKATGMDANRKIMLGLAVALLVVAAGMYGWKVAAVSALESKLAQVETHQAEARAQLLEQARQLDAHRSEEALRRFSVPFAWVIRREVMAANLDQVDH